MRVYGGKLVNLLGKTLQDKHAGCRNDTCSTVPSTVGYLAHRTYYLFALYVGSGVPSKSGKGGMCNMRRAIATLLIPLAVLLTCTSVLASVPPMINYQGKLMQPSGLPVPDGAYHLRFSIYGQPEGGEALWFEEIASVQVKGGLFSVLIGNVPANMFDSPERWFGVAVDGDLEMTPRQRIASSAFAFRAATADTADTVPDGAITTAKLALGAVTTDRLAPNAVTSDKIAAGAVDTAKVADNAITTAKIVDGAVASAKLADGLHLPQLTKRQGGSATDWSTAGTTGYDVTDAVIQCGSTAAGDCAYVTVTFPTAFTETPVVTCQLLNSSITSYAILLTAVSTTQFSFYNSCANNACTVLWVAIGK